MYIVHMKRVTASEARRLWFRLLDEVIAGEVVMIVRGGKRIVIRREEPKRVREEKLPDYSRLLKATGADQADLWRWDWPGPEEPLRFRDDETEP